MQPVGDIERDPFAAMFGGVFGDAIEADERVLHARHAFAGAAGADHQPPQFRGLVREPGSL